MVPFVGTFVSKMSAFAADWLNLLLRWAHLIAGIGWIGTSFYFIALDLSLERRAGAAPGIAGSAWQVHGGGFYHVEKYQVAPQALPAHLVWFRWEAYVTWLTGFALLVVQHYLNPGAWLIDPAVAALAPPQAIMISIASLAFGWFVYDGICRSRAGDHPVLLAGIVFALILAAAWIYTHIFSARSALVHVGALAGTFMAANVFAVIVPNQKKIVAALRAGEKPDPRHGEVGKQRSVHNTYLTLPVLVLMVSGHYPLLTGHPQAWLLVGLIIVGGASARHLLVYCEVGRPFKALALTAPVIVACLAFALWMTAPPPRDDSRNPAAANDAEVLHIVYTHCTTCHAHQPVSEVFRTPPANVVLETLDDVRRYARLVEQNAVETHVMPLGNMSSMSEEERQRLGAWLARIRP